MKTSKFTEAQIAFALKQAEPGTKVDEVCCRNQYGGHSARARLRIDCLGNEATTRKKANAMESPVLGRHWRMGPQPLAAPADERSRP